jgi:hypothetical protein
MNGKLVTAIAGISLGISLGLALGSTAASAEENFGSPELIAAAKA